MWKYDVKGDNFPNLRTESQEWMSANNLYGVTAQGMDLAFRRVFALLGLTLKKTTHMRKYGAAHLQRLPFMPDDEIQSLGYWNDMNRAKLSSVMMDAYLAVNPKACMHAAEHPSHEFVLLPRQREEPPKVLLDTIFPQLDEMKATIAERASTPNANYRAAMNFLDVLDFARKCFLQDMAVLQQEGFKSDAFSHRVFRHGAWKLFKQRVQKRIELFTATSLSDMAQQSGVSEVAKQVAQISEKITTMGSQLDSMAQILKGWETCDRPITQMENPRVVPNLQRTRAFPTAPVNTKDFSSLRHLWACLVDPGEDSPSMSYMEAEALSPTWRKDPRGSSRRRKFWAKLKRLHHWVESSVNDGLVASVEAALDHLEEHMQVHEAGVGSLLMLLEARKIPRPGTRA